MPSFYQIIPPPKKDDQPVSGNFGYLIREQGNRRGGSGIWMAIACAALCLSIVVALCGSISSRSWPAIRNFFPVSWKGVPAETTTTPVAPDPGLQTPLQTATNPLRWNDLTLMLRTGLSDDKIIAEIAAKQLVVPIGAAQEAALHEMGAGSHLLTVLRGRRLYAAPATDASLAGGPAAGVALPAAAAVQPIAISYAAAPMDYAARDRQVASLQARIDELDERIRRIRINPGQYWYNRDYGIDRQQGMDRYLNQLDKERNDLRRQKWQLEGR